MSTKTIVAFAFLFQRFWRKRSLPMQAPSLDGWVELMNAEISAPVAVGRRVANLPSHVFGPGAMLMFGAVNLDSWPAPFQERVMNDYKPVSIGGNWVLAKMVMAAGQDETLVLSEYQELEMIGKLRVALKEHADDIDLRVVVCTQSIQLMDNAASREQFDADWHRYAAIDPAA